MLTRGLSHDSRKGARRRSRATRPQGRGGLRRAAVVVACLAAWGCGSGASGRDAVDARLQRGIEAFRSAGILGISIDLPAVAAGVAFGDAPVTTVAAGVADLATRGAVTPDDVFRVGSVTKTFTAALMLQLDQEGVLALSDPLARWVDWPGGESIRIHNLLDMTSGIPDVIDVPDYQTKLAALGTPTPADWVGLVRDEAPLSKPGETYHYSNTNYELLGIIAERATGRPWASEVQERFLDRYALRSSGIPSTGRAPDPITGYRLTCSSPQDCPAPGWSAISRPGAGACVDPGPASRDCGFDYDLAWAAGEMVMDARDATRWIRELVTGDVLDAAHRARMLEPSPQSIAHWNDLRANSTAYELQGQQIVVGYALGIIVVEVPGVGRGYGYQGAIAGFMDMIASFPDADLTLAVLTTTDEASIYLGFQDVLAEVAPTSD